MADYIYDNDESENDSVNNEGQENGNAAPSEDPGIGQQPAGQQPGGYQYYQPPYGYGYPYQPIPPQPPKKRGGRTALVVLTILLATVVLATAAGIGGYMLVNGQQEPPHGGSYTDDDHRDTADETTAAVDPSTGVVLAPESLGTKDKGTIAEVAAKVADSVVEITTEYAQQNGFYYTYGAGSGVIIDEGGYIITNNHVINGDSGTASAITVRLTNGKSYDAKIIGADSDSDIAVLKIEAEGLTAAAIGTSSTLVVGEEVVIIGNPLGTLGGSVSNGIISALDREITVENETMNLMQTNAAVNPGNSGGGMFNMAGELIGIVNAKYLDTGIEGLGFAIPIDDAVKVANEILEYGYVRGRVSLHISVVEVSSYQQMMQYRVNALGVYVMEPEEGYNDNVLKVGDRIASVDGAEILTFADLRAILKRHSVGDKLNAVIMRGGSMVEVTIVCYEKTVSDVQLSGEN